MKHELIHPFVKILEENNAQNKKERIMDIKSTIFT